MTGEPPELQEWAAALAFLLEAEQHPAAAVPRMAIHAAYYAMFHGARAVLVRLDGASAAKKHNPVVGRFGYHAKAVNDQTLMAAGKTLNTAQELREMSDYGTGPGPEPATAVALLKDARVCLETCARVHGFPALRRPSALPPQAPCATPRPSPAPLEAGVWHFSGAKHGQPGHDRGRGTRAGR